MRIDANVKLSRQRGKGTRLNTVLYCIHSGPRRDEALDAPTPRTRGRPASADDPRAVGPGITTYVQDEAGRRRPVDGAHASGGEPLQHPEPRRGPGDAPSLPGDQTVCARTLLSDRPWDDALGSDRERERVLLRPHAHGPVLRVPQEPRGHRSPLHGLLPDATSTVADHFGLWEPFRLSMSASTMIFARSLNLVFACH